MTYGSHCISWEVRETNLELTQDWDTHVTLVSWITCPKQVRNRNSSKGDVWYTIISRLRGPMGRSLKTQKRTYRGKRNLETGNYMLTESEGLKWGHTKKLSSPDKRRTLRRRTRNQTAHGGPSYDPTSNHGGVNKGKRSIVPEGDRDNRLLNNVYKTSLKKTNVTLLLVSMK